MCDDGDYDERKIDGQGGCRLVVRGGCGRAEVFLGIVPRDRDRDVVLRMRAALLAARDALIHDPSCRACDRLHGRACDCGAVRIRQQIDDALRWPPEDAWHDNDEPLIGVVLDQCALADLHETVRLMQPRGVFRWPAKFHRFRRSTR